MAKQLGHTHVLKQMSLLRSLRACAKAKATQHHHDGCHQRLNHLIRTRDPCWAELALLLPIVASKLYGVLVAVEYALDDGVGKQFGDALFFDYTTNRLFAVECKLISEQATTKLHHYRMSIVQHQAIKCARRIRSYLNHLCTFDKSLDIFSNTVVIPVILTNQKHLELPGIEPGSLDRGQCASDTTL